MSNKHPVLLGITGASGSIYADRLIHYLDHYGYDVEVIFTDAGKQVVEYEKAKEFSHLIKKTYSINNFFAPPASGTSKYHSMVVVPCSMGTLSKIACGTGDNLLTRAADVFIKEKKPLLIVPREMPYSSIHLENMLKLSNLGVRVMSANPFFYYHPKDMIELVDTVIGKILDAMGIEHEIFKPWGQA